MKNKIVVWGTNAANEKVLIALELQVKANKVMLLTFSESIATEEFVTKMMNEWRDGKEVDFPEGYTSAERELSVTEGLLPDDLRVERGDVIQRAQTEWHFAVLSSKLHQAYEQELADFKEKVERLSAYDNKLWDGLKSFWDKVQSQSRERNLFREHADNLRDNINVLFEDLKKMRTKVQGEFMVASATVADEFNKALDDVEARIATGGSRLNSVFDELKQMQHRYKEARMSNEHRNQIWNRLDEAFKKAKERKFGPSANDGSLAERHDRRLVGLADAVKRMSDSVNRDDEELEFQRKKIHNSEGQLESQIRMAKIKMIEERLGSKREKLDEMKRTMADVERQANVAKNKEAKRAEKEAERQQIEAAKASVKSEIAAEIKTKTSVKSEEKTEGLFEAAATVLGDVLLDALDTAKAIASVVAEKAEEAYDNATENKVGVVEKAKAVAGIMADKAEEAFEKVMDKAEEVIESFKTPEPSPEPPVETPAESTENSEPVVNVETAATAEVTAEVISEAIEVATEAVEEPKSPTKEDA
jgi:chromosome segregation ATPase